MILLVHESTTSGQVATPAHVGAPHNEVPSRRYEHEGAFLALDGDEDAVAFDARLILQIRGYRLATPEEQNKYQKQRAKVGKLEEKQAEKDEA